MVASTQDHLVHSQTLFQSVAKLLVALVTSLCTVVNDDGEQHLRMAYRLEITQLQLVMISANGQLATKSQLPPADTITVTLSTLLLQLSMDKLSR